MYEFWVLFVVVVFSFYQLSKQLREASIGKKYIVKIGVETEETDGFGIASHWMTLTKKMSLYSEPSIGVYITVLDIPLEVTSIELVEDYITTVSCSMKVADEEAFDEAAESFSEEGWNIS